MKLVNYFLRLFYKSEFDVYELINKLKKDKKYNRLVNTYKGDELKLKLEEYLLKYFRFYNLQFCLWDDGVLDIYIFKLVDGEIKYTPYIFEVKDLSEVR